MLSYNEAIATCEKLKEKNFKYKNIDDVYQDLKNIESLLRDCKNELCLNCGKYKNEHLGACEGCRWK